MTDFEYLKLIRKFRVNRKGTQLGLVWVLIIISWLGAGCGSSSSGLGSLEVRIRDHQEAIDHFNELWLTFSGLDIHPTGQPRTEGWIELEPSLRELDLTEYVEGPEAVIVQATVEAGAYNAVRLTVDQASGTLTDGQQTEVEVNLDPVALDFQIRGGQTTTLVLDIVVLDVSEHSGPRYELHIREVKVTQITKPSRVSFR